MKKRIIASTMASVMALSAGTSLMASAAVTDFKDQSVNKATLRKLIQDPEIVDLIENDGLAQYGSISGANFMKAYDYANAVLEDVEAGDDQATVAYQMVIATKANLVQHTADELKILVESLRGIRDTNNELNERGDSRYTEKTWDKFVTAFDNADDYKDYDDILVTTDAYEELDEAKALEEMPTRTKIQIDSAARAYEQALQMEYKYQPWVRGTVSAAKTDYDGLSFAWGMLYAHVKSGQSAVMNVYEEFDVIKGLNITSDPDIVAAVDAMELAAKVLNGFSANYETGSSQAAVNRLLAQYHGQLVFTYNAAEADLVVKSLASEAGGDDAFEVKVNDKYITIDTTSELDSLGTNRLAYWNTKFSASTEYKPLGGSGKTDKEVVKLIKAELTVRTSKDGGLYYILDNGKKLANNNNKLVGVDVNGDGTYIQYFFASDAAAKAALTAAFGSDSGYSVKPLGATKDFTVSNYIGVDSDDVTELILSSANITSDDIDTAFTGVSTWAAAAASAIASLNAKITAAKTAATGLTSGSADYANDTLPQSEKDAIYAAVTGAEAALTAISTTLASIKTASVKSATSTVATFASYREWLNDVNDEYTNLKSKVDAIMETVPDTLSSKATFQDVSDMMNFGGGTNASTADAYSTVKQFTNTGVGYYADVKKKLENAYSAAVFEATKGKSNTVWIRDPADNSVGKSYTYTKDDGSTATKNAVVANKANNVLDTTGEQPFKDDGGTPKKQNKGILFFVNSANSSSFTLAGYTSSRTANTDHKSSETTPSLSKAMNMLDLYNDKNWVSAQGLDNAWYITDFSKAGSTAPTGRAWTLLYTYMKYALEDEFMASADKTYTLKDIKNLLDKSYTLSTDTVQTSLFTSSHMNLIDLRNDASNWAKMADGNASGVAYKENDTIYTVTSGTFDSTGMYNALNDAYSRLNKELAAFKYSYEDIITEMAAIAKAIDGKTFDAATTAKLTEKLQKTAEAFVKVEAVYKDGSDDTLEDSELFNANGTVNMHNRLFTNKSKFDGIYIDDVKTAIAASEKNGGNKTHYDMQIAYEDLVNAYETALKGPEQKITTDVNGDGDFTVADISALLKLFVDNTYDVNKHDFTGDGKVTVDDIVYLVKELIK